jgi:flagellum-specific peptidoglycan hydrolase FlgJ
MQSVRKPWWQQATAIVSLGAGGAVTGLNFVPKAPAEARSPSNMLIRLLAQEKPARPAQPSAADDAALRSAIVSVARHYLRMAAGKTPAEMEAIIWQHDSVDGVDHGQSCAAFASLTLELAAQAVGQQSWVTGGTSYPWPLQAWADVRVEPNPASPAITSVLQDAQARNRWHALGDGYVPRPGDWVLFQGHVEVVTDFSGAVLHTIGGDSLPNFSVNAHAFSGPLSGQGVVGFVNNGLLSVTAANASAPRAPAAQPGAGQSDHGAAQTEQAAVPGGSAAIPGGSAAVAAAPGQAQAHAGAAIPGVPGPSAGTGSRPADRPVRRQVARRAATVGQAAALGQSAIPGLPTAAPSPSAASPAAPPSAHARPGSQAPPTAAPAQAVGAEQAFISQVVPGAIAAQHRYGVPASVTIAQAIDESGWGQSGLAVRDNNLFGIKGSGPAGSDALPTQEFDNGQSVTRTALFRVYHDVAESIDDHGKLLATSGYYRRAMADRQDPNAFAAALTGVYATDPTYGAKLIGLMQQYSLYRYDNAAAAAAPRPARHAAAAAPRARKATPSRAAPSSPAPTQRVSTPPTPTPTPAAPTTVAPSPSAPASSAAPTPAASDPAASSPAASSPAGPSPSASSPAASSPAASSPAASSPAASTPVTPRAAGAGGTRVGAGGARPAGPRGASRLTAAGEAAIPGLPPTAPAAAASTAVAPSLSPTPGPSRQTDAYQASAAGMTATETMFIRPAPPHSTRQAHQAPRTAAHSPRATGSDATSRPARPARGQRPGRAGVGLYQHHMSPAVLNAMNTTARARLAGAESLYRDVASHSGIRWELLAACDWMQCEARPRYSPVHGEKLGTVNPDGTVYRTRSEALEQCGDDLVALAWEVYGIDLASDEKLSVRDLASAFAAFRWGGLLKLHRTSAMEFPYSVAGLTPQHAGMRWPNIDEPNAPDKPGSRFRMPFGAVPVVLGLKYPAVL